MNTGNTIKIITISLIVIALMSVTAFAAVGQPISETSIPLFTDQE